MRSGNVLKLVLLTMVAMAGCASSTPAGGNPPANTATFSAGLQYSGSVAFKKAAQ